MKTRREFISHALLGLTAALASLTAACGQKPVPENNPAPDSETAPSPEWPPKDE